MISQKREYFLSSFFSAFGAERVKCTKVFANYVAGTVFFPDQDSREPQGFQWEMTEREAPDERVLSLMEFLNAENFLNSGRLIKPAADIEVPELDKQQKKEAFGELFHVRVQMVPGKHFILKAAARDQ